MEAKFESDKASILQQIEQRNREAEAARQREAQLQAQVSFIHSLFIWFFIYVYWLQ